MQRAISILLILVTAAVWAVYGNTLAGSLLAVVVLLLLGSIALNFLMRNSIDIRMSLGGAVRSGAVDVLLTVTNDAVVPIPFVRGRVLVENTYTGERSQKRITIPLPPKKDNTVNLGVSTEYCGKYRVIVEKIGLCDLLGLSVIPAKVSAQCNFTVIPEIFDTEIRYGLQETDSFDNDTYSPYKKGRDRSEVYQIREYEEGDPLNQIHWKLSSKIGKIIVKDPSQPISKSLAVIFDKSNPAAVSAGTTEAMAEIAVSVGEALLQEGLTFQLMWNDGEGRTILTKAIQFEDEFTEAIPQILTGGITVGSESFADLHTVLMGQLNASHIIYICPAERIIPDTLTAGSVVKLLGDNPHYRDDYSQILL